MNLLVGSWEDRRPVWLLFLLYQLSDEQLKQANTPMLDTYLAQRGQSIGKQLYSIETPDEQCNPLISIDQEQVNKQPRRLHLSLVNFCHKLHVVLLGMDSEQPPSIDSE